MGKMLQGSFLVFIQILQQAAGGNHTVLKIRNAQPAQGTHPKMLLQTVFTVGFIKISGFQGINGNAQPVFQIRHIDSTDKKGIIAYDFRGHILIDLVDEFFAVFNFRQKIIPGGHICHGNPDFTGKPGNTHQIVILAVVQGLDIQIGAWRHNPHHLPADNPPRLFGIFHLFADCHFISHGNQFVQIPFHCMIGDAAHGRFFLLSAAFAGQGNLQRSGSRQRVLIEHFIKIPQPVKQDTILILLFGFHILLHHRRQFSHALSPVLYGQCPPGPFHRIIYCH